MTRINDKKLQLTTPDLVVLSLLSEHPMHGYDLNQELERRDVRDWAGISRPQVYYSLNKLKSLQMITEVFVANKNAAGPDRQVYQISQKGKQGLRQSLDSNDWAINRTISPFLTWMALSSHAANKSIIRMINERKKFLEDEMKREKLTFKTFKNETGPMIAHAQLMVEFTIKQFATELLWLKKVKKLNGNKNRSQITAKNTG